MKRKSYGQSRDKRSPGSPHVPLALAILLWLELRLPNSPLYPHWTERGVPFFWALISLSVNGDGRATFPRLWRMKKGSRLIFEALKKNLPLQEQMSPWIILAVYTVVVGYLATESMNPECHVVISVLTGSKPAHLMCEVPGTGQLHLGAETSPLTWPHYPFILLSSPTLNSPDSPYAHF